MFLEKSINKTKIHFLGLDRTNKMSGERESLQKHVRHLSPFAVYINCHNHSLSLFLAHLKKYSELESLEKFYFCYGSLLM